MSLKSAQVSTNGGAASQSLPDPPAAPGGSPGSTPKYVAPDLGRVLPEAVSQQEVLQRNREKWSQ
jgi:hypothetical protein